MRAIVLSVVLVASPALAQQTSPASQPPSTPAPSVPAPTAPVPTAETPVSAAPKTATPDSSQIPQAIDPLADLISQSQTLDEEEAETAGKPAPRHRPTILPIPEPETPAIPQGGYVPADQVYEMRVKGSVAAAQRLQGPLDGGWRVSGADGAQIYALQLVDKAGGYGVLEGAWRDVRRPGTVGSTGLIDDLRRDGDTVIAQFTPNGSQAVVLTLRSLGDDRWSGELVEAGARQAVVVEHLLPEAPPGYQAQGRGPYVWPPRVAAAPRADSAPACSTKGKKGKALKAAKAKCAAAAKKKSRASALKKGKSSKATASRKGKASAKKSAPKKKKR